MPRDYSKEICAYLRSIDVSLGKLAKSLERITDGYDEEKMNGVYNVITPVINKAKPCSEHRNALYITSMPLDELTSYDNEWEDGEDDRN